MNTKNCLKKHIKKCIKVCNKKPLAQLEKGLKVQYQIRETPQRTQLSEAAIPYALIPY
jgi:hypothetical protein